MALSARAMVGACAGAGARRPFRMAALAGASLIALVACLAVATPSAAQTLNDQLAGRGQGPGRLLVEADQLVYDNDRNTVSAVGNAQLVYQGRTLEADRVVYDRGTRRVVAEGNVRLTDENGGVTTGSRFELTDDFKDGFIESLRVEQKTVDNGTPVTARFTSPRAERAGGETTTFERGTYTACDACKDAPERPPLWQVKAAKIIHDNTERMVYYEDATLELFGLPVAYLPYFSNPDPTVKRKTGFLVPNYVHSTALGTGASLPFFWNIAPNYDLTVTPTFLSRQGLLGEVEWRHRLLNGSYNIRAAGIFQADGTAFLPSPQGARDRDFRGSVESTGKFYINERWTTGWDIVGITDKWFLRNYRIKSESLAETLYQNEAVSTAYLTGKGPRSFFDVRGYYFKPLSYTDWQKQQPIVHPVLDYDRRFDGPGAIGGEVGLDVNLTSLSREATAYAGLPQSTIGLVRTKNSLGEEIGLFENCAVFSRATCLVRGIAGTHSRFSANATWRRAFTDPLGQVFTPFAGVRVDGISFQPTLTGYANPLLSSIAEVESDFFGRFMPTAGVEYRFPFIAASSWGAQVIEPVAQLMARPNEQRVGDVPNEDSQSLIFDDTNLFDWNKYAGYDRIEGGVRANYGLRYTLQGDNGFYANALFGQSAQIAGRNSFEQLDLTNTGLQSGLDQRLSDYVGRVQVTPSQGLSFIGRGRFDEADFTLRRFEAQAVATYGSLTTSVTYANYDAQPLLGQPTAREGLVGSARYRVTPNWYVSGAVLLDLDKYTLAKDALRTNLNSTNTSTRLDPLTTTLAGVSLGVGYADECTTFSIAYSSSFKDLANGTKEPDHTIALKLELRTLGGLNYSYNPSATGTTGEGVNPLTTATGSAISP